VRVLLVNYEYPPIGGGGGKATKNLAIALSQLGCKVDILTSKYKSYSIGQHPKGIRVYKVNSWRKSIHDCGLFGALSFVVLAAPIFLKLLRKNNYQAVHYFFSMPTGLLSLLTRKKQNRQSIISLRGSDVPGYDPYNKTLQILHKILKPVTKMIWSRADSVIAVTNSLKEEAQKTCGDIEIKVLPNGVEEHFFKMPKEKTSRSKCVFITVSRLIERKGIGFILRALKKVELEEIELRIIGDGSYKSELKKMVNDFGMKNRVHFLGFVPSPEIPKLLAEADVFILPSLAEAFGNVFAEAMAAGLPIIATDQGGIADLVKKEGGILVPIDSDLERSISVAMATLIANPDLRNKMGKYNSVIMQKDYRWENIAKRYIQVYSN
jgi:glycosyltransferase involved in cell wall biosynthesis